MAHTVKNALTTIHAGRLAGVTMLVAAMLAALVMLPANAAAEDDDDDAGDNGSRVIVNSSTWNPADTEDEDNEGSNESGEIDAVENGNEQDDDDGDNGDAGETGDSGDDADGDDSHDDGTPDASTPDDGTGDVPNIEDILGAQVTGLSLVDYLDFFDITGEELVALLMTEIEAQLDAAVANGDLTREQADSLLVEAEEHLNVLVNVDDDRDDEGDGAEAGFENYLSLEVVASLTGTTVERVESALDRGLTLASFAERHGVTGDQLIASFVIDIQMQIEQDVADGALTREEADAILATLEADVAAYVTGGVEGDDATGDDGDIPDDNGDNGDVPDENGDNGAEAPDLGDFGNPLETAEIIAALTGTTVDDVMAAVENGQSLVDFVSEHGVSVDELHAVVAAELETQVQAAVDAGLLAQEEADMILMNATEIVDGIINWTDLGEFTTSTRGECVSPLPTDGSAGEQAPARICPATN